MRLGKYSEYGVFTFGPRLLGKNGTGTGRSPVSETSKPLEAIPCKAAAEILPFSAAFETLLRIYNESRRYGSTKRRHSISSESSCCAAVYADPKKNTPHPCATAAE
ncbi:MAG: hypothetical protein QW815_04565, partial [Nitrososphaerota archaeon]